MKAFGQIIKSLFILRYIDEVELREVIEKQLNKVELANRFTRAVAVIPFGIMLVRSIRHRGLRRLLEDDNPRFLPQNLVVRVRNILTVLVLARDMEEFAAFARPGWRIHRLSGERQNEWSISVSGNLRITFAEMDGAIERLNLEDYH